MTIFRTSRIYQLLAFGIVLSMAVLLVPSAFADSVSDAEQAADAAKAEYDAAVKSYEDALTSLDAAKAETEQMRTVAEDSRVRANSSARALYVGSNDRFSVLVDMAVSGASLGEILDEMDSLNRIYDYHMDALVQAKEDLKALEDQEVRLGAAADEASSKKDDLEEAMNEALEAYEEAQAEAAAAASSSSGGGYSESSYVAPGVIGDVPSEVTVSVSEMMFMGVVYANGYRYTYYNESVLPGQGLEIPARHHDNGMICDGDGYICVASSDLPKGTIVPTPLGRAGKVYDSGCASGTIDLYLV